MNKQELFSRMAAGDYTVTSKVAIRDASSNVGKVMAIIFYGSYINLTVAYPGTKWEVTYHENEEVSYRDIHYLSELR